MDSLGPLAPGPVWTRPSPPSAGDTLVVPKLDRLARSVPDARAIGDALAARDVRLSLGGSIYDPADPMGKMFFNILATFAEFEVDVLRMRTREGMAIARDKGKLRGKPPKLTARQQRELVRMNGTGDYSIADLAEVFSVSRATAYRVLNRNGTPREGDTVPEQSPGPSASTSRDRSQHSRRPRRRSRPQRVADDPRAGQRT
jgi:DNA invertase Pin-like site-specific DNA recombinase